MNELSAKNIAKFGFAIGFVVIALFVAVSQSEAHDADYNHEHDYCFKTWHQRTEIQDIIKQFGNDIEFSILRAVHHSNKVHPDTNECVDRHGNTWGHGHEFQLRIKQFTRKWTPLKTGHSRYNSSYGRWQDYTDDLQNPDGHDRERALTLQLDPGNFYQIEAREVLYDHRFGKTKVSRSKCKIRFHLPDDYIIKEAIRICK